MRELKIGINEQGQRLDKYLKKYFSNAPSSFLYKMLRKKNILVNNKKAVPEQMLQLEDRITLYLAEETIEKFRVVNKTLYNEYSNAYEQYKNKVKVVFEDEHFLLLQKPAGILSQKANRNDLSMNEYAIGYLLEQNSLTKEQLQTFKPSICNRLDRNTSGILIVGKSLQGLQKMGELIQKRTLQKFYVCVVEGKVKEPSLLEGFLEKDEKNNQVTIYQCLLEEQKQQEQINPIKTFYKPLRGNERTTLLEVELITGKTHQIRAHLASIHHSIIGDYKYGQKEVNSYYESTYGIKYQLLHAYRLVFPKDRELGELAGRTIEIPIPEVFEKCIKD
ncbi:MAG: RluA family pseudouridine synthase [Eubacteriales bacterium]